MGERATLPALKRLSFAGADESALPGRYDLVNVAKVPNEMVRASWRLTCRRSSEILDISTPEKAARHSKGPVTRNFAVASREVLIVDNVPAEAVTLIK
jgi:hypothetical protein